MVLWGGKKEGVGVKCTVLKSVDLVIERESSNEADPKAQPAVSACAGRRHTDGCMDTPTGSDHKKTGIPASRGLSAAEKTLKNLGKVHRIGNHLNLIGKRGKANTRPRSVTGVKGDGTRAYKRSGISRQNPGHRAAGFIL